MACNQENGASECEGKCPLIAKNSSVVRDVAIKAIVNEKAPNTESNTVDLKQRDVVFVNCNGLQSTKLESSSPAASIFCSSAVPAAEKNGIQTSNGRTHSQISSPAKECSPGQLTDVCVSANNSDSDGVTCSTKLLPEKGNSPAIVATSPNGSCLRANAKGGPHVQFETPPGQVDLFCGDGVSEESREIERTGYWVKAHPERGVDSENSSTSKKKKQRHISGSSNTSVGSSSSAMSEGGELQRRAPDGGWGWMVVLASFSVHCIADGVTMSFGVLFTELLDYFEESKSFTSLVGSLFMAIPLLAGPIASMLTDHFGCRKVTIMGSVIACIGFFLSAFANSILLLLVTLGLITGLGLAVCYVAAIVIVAFYFEKKRSLATGIAVAGSGIGTFVFAPFMQHLIDVYTWRGCLVIIAGIFLNMSVCGALMRDLQWTKKRNDKRSQSTLPGSKPDSTFQSSESVTAMPDSLQCPPINELRKIVQSGDVSVLLSPEDSPTKFARSSSMLMLPTFISRTQTVPNDVLSCLNSRANAFEVVSKMYPHLLSQSFREQIDLLPILSDTRLHRIAEPAKISSGELGKPSTSKENRFKFEPLIKVSFFLSIFFLLLKNLSL